MLEKKFAKIEMMGDKVGAEKRGELEERRQEVKSSLAKLKEKRCGKLANPMEREGQEVGNRPEV